MKYIIITGAYGGMGKSTIELFSNNGYFVFALDKNIGESKTNILPIAVDITNIESVNNAYDIIKTYTDKLDGIIHFAGLYMLNSLIEIDENKFKKIIDVNLYGVYLINKTFFNILNKNSKIIITTSELATLNPLPFTGIYAISKISLDNYAYSLRMELQLLGINVSVIRAGAVQTNLLNTSTSELENFTNNTFLYDYNANRFKNIVSNVESKCISPNKIALLSYKIFCKKHPKFAYSINRNILLKLLNILPTNLQFYVIKKILIKK